MTLEAVIFDWGGTLSVYADIDMEDMWRLAARHLAPDREDEVCAALVALEARSWARVKTDQQSTRLSELLGAANAELGLDVAEAVLEEAATHHLDSWTPHIRHDPDARPVLEQLRDRGLRIGLLSNTHWPRTFHERFLERDGLGELIDVRCYTSEMAHTKPHVEAFKTVMHGLGAADAASCVFVGDRRYDDILGAKGAGMRAVLRPNAMEPGGGGEPDGVIQRLPELLDIIERWCQ
jgi:putative hydrolase of the HAD superfamily